MRIGEKGGLRPGTRQMRDAFGEALLEAARADPRIVALDGDGKDLKIIDLKLPVSPLEALVLEKDEPLPAKAAAVRLVLLDAAGKEIGELARTQIKK